MEGPWLRCELNHQSLWSERQYPQGDNQVQYLRRKSFSSHRQQSREFNECHTESLGCLSERRHLRVAQCTGLFRATGGEWGLQRLHQYQHYDVEFGNSVWLRFATEHDSSGTDDQWASVWCIHFDQEVAAQHGNGVCRSHAGQDTI